MIHVVLGTKAQLIKMAPVMACLESQGIPYNFIFTGQHKETIDQLLGNFGIKKPDYLLYDGREITGAAQTGAWSVKVLLTTFRRRRHIFNNDKNGIILVHGDTLSTLLGAIMGKAAKLYVGHVESGLRSFNLLHPFPEELTRVAVFRLADYYFCPGGWAMGNVAKYKGVKIDTVENTLLDSLRLAVEKQHTVDVPIPQEQYCVVTVHRFENIFKQDALGRIVSILERIARKLRILFILHPPTKQQLEKFDFAARLASNENIELRPRYDYFEFIKLITHSEFVLSDGGSNQEECYYLGKACLLLRNKTERKEGLGRNVVLSGFNLDCIDDFVENYASYKCAGVETSVSPSARIVDSIRRFA